MSTKAIGLEGWPKEVIEALKAIAGAYEEILEKAKVFAELGEDCVAIDWRADRDGWREAALLAGQRAAARAKVYGLRMQLEKARRALRRRKRLHDDSGLPDW